ncbi:MAG: DUF4190 domain-containing protein [Streptosporangiales bacterium]|nr:DUF4190 domain-containing protein [Streptosporangiales bacterium]
MTEGPQQPGRQPETPRAGATERGGFIAVLMSLAGVALFPIGVVLSIMAVRTGRQARRRAAANQAVAPGATAGVIIGWFGIAFSTLAVISIALFWSETESYMACNEGANTITAQTHCRNALEADLEQRLGRPITLPF